MEFHDEFQGVEKIGLGLLQHLTLGKETAIDPWWHSGRGAMRRCRG
jgi:hypothetical protein